MDTASIEKPALTLRRLASFDPAGTWAVGGADFVIDAPGAEDIATLCAGIVLPEAADTEARAATLLAAGAPLVLVGEAALVDSRVIERLANAFPGRVGIFAPVRRQPVSWSFETVSNADFKTVTPSYCEPAWEVLTADGTPTGTLASWWLKVMRDLGAAQFLVQAEVRDDVDLNILAGLVEEFGATFWACPRGEGGAALADWVVYGQCQQLVLPEHLFVQRVTLLADILPVSTSQEVA